MTRILIFYIVRNSGHHTAARALENAFHKCGPEIETRCINLLNFTHPKWERIIQRMYMTTIRRTPELWEALYDNFWVEYLTRRLRGVIQRGQSDALGQLMEDFAPDAVVCTQAYPLAVMASVVARHRCTLPLFGVTTDFVPHRFWVLNGACDVHYVVATEAGAARLMWLGIPADRIRTYGIPVRLDHKGQHHARSQRQEQRRILVMGGGRGIGIRYRTVRRLDACPEAFTIDVVCGMNRRLQQRLVRGRHQFRHPIRVRGYVRNAVALMSRADLMITKAGGMTLAEATCMGVPLLLVRSLPGQERGNTEVMVHHGAALHLVNEVEVARSVSTLLGNPALLAIMQRKALALARPHAAEQIAGYVLEHIADRTAP